MPVAVWLRLLDLAEWVIRCAPRESFARVVVLLVLVVVLIHAVRLPAASVTGP